MNKDIKNAYLHSIKIMYAHCDMNTSKSEKQLIKEIEHEILQIIGLVKNTGDKSVYYYDSERNKS